MRFLCLLFLSLSASLTHAQDWFEIEVIIFEHKSAQYSSQPNTLSNSEDAERWSSDLDLSWPSPLLELQPAVERAEPVEIFPPFEELVFEQRRMNNDSYALRVRDPYELLWHKAWKAPLLPEGQAPWILVQAGEELGEHYRLEGAIRVHLSRYLHLSTNLWLTEVSGNAIIEEILNSEEGYSGETIEKTETSLPDSEIKDIDARSEFDWSQLPELASVRWGCNHIRENWPEDNRLLPADYYEDPAPADWYYPFGCLALSEYIDRDIPYFVNMPTSDRYAEAELEINYPELFVQPKVESDIFDSVSVEADSSMIGDTTAEPKEAPFSQAHSIDTQALLENIEVIFLNEDGSYESYENTEAELIRPAPKVHYPVKEIIHIQGKRRMRSGEFHYIDHPKIGVLAIIHPVEKPELVLEPESEPEDVPDQ